MFFNILNLISFDEAGIKSSAILYIFIAIEYFSWVK